jgi:hypothetical protein
MQGRPLSGGVQSRAGDRRFDDPEMRATPTALHCTRDYAGSVGHQYRLGAFENLNCSTLCAVVKRNLGSPLASTTLGSRISIRRYTPQCPVCSKIDMGPRCTMQ